MKKIVLIAVLGMFVSAADAQDQKVVKKVDRKVNIVQDNDQVKLKVIENGSMVLDKTYGSMEELKADPEVQSLNVHVGGTGKKIVFKGNEVMETEFGTQTGLMWVQGDVDVDHDVHVNVTKDAEGNMVIERNGEIIDVDAEGAQRIKVKKLEDGSIEIEDENGIRRLDAEEMKKGDVTFFSEGDESGVNVFHFKDGERLEEIVELKGDAVWVSDSLHESDGNMIFIREDSDIQIDENGEGKTIIIREDRVDGASEQIVRIVVEKLHLKISDVEDLSTVEEIPGSQVLSNKMLDLEEVNYYPNPSDGIFNLKFASKKKPTQVRIIDMMGKEVYSENMKDFDGYYDQSIDLSSSEKGVYILQVLQGEKSWNKKLVIE